MRVRITVEQYDAMEWAIELNGMLWAAGDCTSVADGMTQAHEQLRRAGIDVHAREEVAS